MFAKRTNYTLMMLVMVACVGVLETYAQCGPNGNAPYVEGTEECAMGGGMGDGGGGGGTPGAGVEGHAVSLLGDVALTTVGGVDVRTNNQFFVDENIYGPFEAGFTENQNFILEGLGCSDGNLGHVVGGIDTQTAEAMVAYQCNITLPRIEGNRYISLLDECGGHTNEYHLHERLSCLYTEEGTHSTRVGKTVVNNASLYGKWEDYSKQELPLLDACGGHFGRTPESPDEDVYHYHVQEKPPFTIGCIGPTDEGELVTVETCRSYYPGCDGELESITTKEHGTYDYDLWCPCYDATGSNTGVNITPLPIFSNATTEAPTTTTQDSETTQPPAPSPAPPPSPKTPPKNVLFFMPDDMPFIWDEAPSNPDGSTIPYDTSIVPNMDRIRREGVVFLNAYTGGPKCAPARHSLIAGRYCARSLYGQGRSNSNNGNTRTAVTVPNCKIEETDKAKTIAHSFSSSFVPTIAGKYHIMQPPQGGAFSDYDAVDQHAKDLGFEHPAGLYESNMGSGDLNFTHNMEWTVATANNVINEALGEGRNFYLYFAPTIPHGPRVLQAMNNGNVRETPNGTLDQDPISGMATRPTVVGRVGGGASEYRDTNIGNAWCDDALGALIKNLEDQDKLKDTLVIFTLDHGMISKDSLLEGGTRVALFMRHPGSLKAGLQIHTPVSHLDLAPTILEAVGAPAASYTMDGKSFWKAITAEEEPQERCILSEIDNDRAMRCGKWKYWSKMANDGTITEELYDLSIDEHEETDVVTAEANEDLVAAYRRYMDCFDLTTALTGSTTCDFFAVDPLLTRSTSTTSSTESSSTITSSSVSTTSTTVTITSTTTSTTSSSTRTTKTTTTATTTKTTTTKSTTSTSSTKSNSNGGTGASGGSSSESLDSTTVMSLVVIIVLLLVLIVIVMGYIILRKRSERVPVLFTGATASDTTFNAVYNVPADSPEEDPMSI